MWPVNTGRNSDAPVTPIDSAPVNLLL